MKHTILHEISSIIFIVLISCFLHYTLPLPRLTYPYNALLCGIAGAGCLMAWVGCRIKGIEDYVCSFRCSRWLCMLWIVIILCLVFMPYSFTCAQVHDISMLHTCYAAIIAWGITWLCLSGKIIISLRTRRTRHNAIGAYIGIMLISAYIIPGRHDTCEHRLNVNGNYTVFLVGGDSIKVNNISMHNNPIANISILYAAQEHTYALQANSPIRYKHWDISLLSCNRHTGEAVLLLVYDPHRYLFLTGMLLVLLQWAVSRLIPIVFHRKRSTCVQ